MSSSRNLKGFMNNNKLKNYFIFEIMKKLFRSPYKLRTRIYVSMLALIVGSFFFIGIFTYYNFKTQNQNYHDNRLLRKEAATLASISYFLEAQKGVEHSGESISKLFRHKIYELSDIHKLDIIIYNLKGDLILSSNKEITQNDIIPHKLDKQLLKELREEKSSVKKGLTNFGMDYLNSYQYIADTRQAPIAIISIPYFQLDENYKRDLQTYLVALTPIYILLFLGASILAFLLSRQITGPMRRISEIMRKAALMKRYMPLKWNSSDEIGQLVHQYNFMVKELEKSSEMIAQNEKESAWKEMAKQVAHEIKNPLTPMKLSVQIFERKLDPNDPEFKNKMRKFTSSMVEQIDTLANIASAFSDFARMPSSNKEEVNLTKITESALIFFDAVKINFTKTTEPCYVYADKNQLIRILNNILNNAIEAIPENKTPLINVSLEQINENAKLTIQDNGIGIAKNLQEKIFEPKFTTKNSGMGLGLAIVKRIIDDLNGSIHFRSEENSGTTFFISIPLLKQKN